MNTEEQRQALDSLTEGIIGCGFKVGNALGHGFLEKVYENALAHELRQEGLTIEQQKPIAVEYDGVVVGEYFADLLVENQVLVELKAVKQFDKMLEAQCLNYLKASGLSVCLLLNFGASRVQVKRLVWDF